MPFASRLVNLPQRQAQRLNFPLVSELLAFGQFDKFEHFLHLIERLFERFDNLRHFFNRLADGGSGSFTLAFAQSGRVDRRTDRGNRLRSSRTASTSTVTATSPSTARTLRRRGKI